MSIPRLLLLLLSSLLSYVLLLLFLTIIIIILIIIYYSPSIISSKSGYPEEICPGCMKIFTLKIMVGGEGGDGGEGGEGGGFWQNMFSVQSKNVDLFL